MWISSQNFEILAKFTDGQSTLERFNDEPIPEFKVAFNDLTTDQKKSLVNVTVDFKLYVSSGKVNPKLKGKVVKEPLYKKDDIVSLVKMIYKEPDRDEVRRTILRSGISPVILQQWLLQGCIDNIDAWNTVVHAEQYLDSNVFYAFTIGSESTMGGHFKFPRKLRGD